jgi:tetratricopeptide (TPR) repeat protein
MAQARFEVAQRCFERLLRQGPQAPAVIFQLGQDREALGDPEAAIEASIGALQLDFAATDVLLHLQYARLGLCD